LKHKGVEYYKTETAINFLAIRRVQQRIDREQKAARYQ